MTRDSLAEVPERIEKLLREREAGLDDASESGQAQTIVSLWRIHIELRAAVELARIQTELLLFIAQQRAK